MSIRFWRNTNLKSEKTTKRGYHLSWCDININSQGMGFHSKPKQLALDFAENVESIQEVKDKSALKHMLNRWVGICNAAHQWIRKLFI